MTGVTIIRTLVCCIILIALMPGTSPSRAESPGQRPIRVVMDNNYPPYIFTDEHDKLKGIIVDQWRLWEKKTGIRVELTGMDWSEAQRRMQAGEFDVIDIMFRNERREKLYDFTKPYAVIPVPLFFHSDISGIRGPEDVKGFMVAAKAGGNVIDVLKQHGVTGIVEYPSYEKIVEAARDGKVKVFTVDRPPALYYLNKMGIQNSFRETEPMYSGEFHRAVRKGNTALLQTLEQGFATITPEENKAIEQKWYGSALGDRFHLKYFAYAASVAGGVIVVLLVSNRVLRRLVHKRTADLTASEGRLRTLLQTIPELVWLKDPEGVYLLCNPRFERFFGATEEQIKGRTDYDFVDRELADYFREHDKKAIAADRPSVNEEWVTYADDGHQELLETIKTPMRDADGNLIGVLGIARNITEKNELEKERVQLEKERERSQRLESLGVLAGGIAHDFNNILTGILGNITLVRRIVGEEHKAIQRLAECEKAARRAAELTQQLLTFAKGGEPVRASVNTRQVVEESLAFALRGANAKGVLNCPPDIWCLNADAGQITQVFNNLLINAKQAMPDGGSVTVSLENVTVHNGDQQSLAPGGYVRVSIRDQGTGINEEDLPKVFDPYFTTKRQGNGLGLASVYSIIKRHDGTISVTSLCGEGSTFTLLLPAVPGAHAAQDSQPSPPVLTGKGRILVMDDESLIRELTAVILDELGYEAETCADGREAITRHAIALKSNQPYAAIILDLTVPGGMGGQETALQIRAVDPHTPLIVSSGYSNDAVISECREHGFSGVVRKPYSLEELAAELARVTTLA